MSSATEGIEGVDPTVAPSGTGCVECNEAGGWWVHLRRCAQCGHVGCCDSSPSRHATAHFHGSSHPIVTSFEPGEEWFYDYGKDEMYAAGPRLADPQAHPEAQTVPGPADRVPADWQSRLG